MQWVDENQKELNIKLTEELNRAFDCANRDLFEGKLEKPIISVAPTTGSYGHVSVGMRWTDNKSKGYRELNVNPDYFKRGTLEVLATLLHEMSHIWNMQEGIQDCNGYYHNKKFYTTATEKAKLIIEKDRRYGWTLTRPSYMTVEFMIWNQINFDIIYRNDPFSWLSGIGKIGGLTGKGIQIGVGSGGSGGITPTQKRNNYKWVCPNCGQIARSSKPSTNIICGECYDEIGIAYRMIKK